MSSYRSVDHTSDSAVTVEQLDHVGTSVTRQQLPISAYVDTDREIQAVRCIGLSAKAAQELGLHCNQTMPSVPTKSKQPEKALQFQKIKWLQCVADVDIVFYPCGFFFSMPILSHRRLDIYHTSTHDVALVQI